MAAPSMQAARPAGEAGFEVQEILRPDPPPGEVRLRVRACGICGSDLHFYQAGLMPPGLTPGHEITGVVDAVGAGVCSVAEGDPVVVEPFRTCGRCPECRSGRDVTCREARIFGMQEPGGLAEFVLAPERRLFPVSPALNPEVAALAEPMAVVVHSLGRGRLEPGQRVLVLGAGSVGLLTVLAARALGAGEVWVTARHPHQAEIARALGADRVLGEEDASAAALDALGREQRIDLVVETVGGAADTLRPAVAAVRPGGRVSVVGVFLGSVALDPMPLLLKEVTLAWSYCYHHGDDRADFRDAIALLEARPEDAARVTSHSVPLSEVERGFALASEKKSGVVKVTILPSSEETETR